MKLGSVCATFAFDYFSCIRPYISPNEKYSLSPNEVFRVGLFFIGSFLCLKLLEVHTLQRTRQVINRVNDRRDMRTTAFHLVLRHAALTPSVLGEQRIPREVSQLILEFAGLSSPKK